MFDLQKYIDDTKISRDLRKQASILEEETKLMVHSKNNEIGSKLLQLFKDNFTISAKMKKTLIINSHGGYYVEHMDRIEYNYEIGKNFIDTLKAKYGSSINRNYANDMQLHINYNILKNNFTTKLYCYGFSSTSLITNNTLLTAVLELINVCEKEFEGEDISFEEVKSKFKNVKNYLDNYEAFVIANKLISY